MRARCSLYNLDGPGGMAADPVEPVLQTSAMMDGLPSGPLLPNKRVGCCMGLIMRAVVWPDEN